MMSPFGDERDHFFMSQALKQAYLALKHEEVPVGAIVVSPQGQIIGRGYNQTERRTSQLFHAEAVAMAKAGAKIGDWRLCGCWVYVTLEPCAMCMNLIRLSRCAGVAYGCASPLFGYKEVDKETPFSVYKENVVTVIAGLDMQKSADLLKSFFRAIRIKKKDQL